MSTEASISAIMGTYPLTFSKDWKRRCKYVSKWEGSARVFENVKTNECCTVYCLKGGDVVVKAGDLLPKTDPVLIKALVNAANKIRHCGDYCSMFWNPSKQIVWMCMGDGDCPSETDDISDEEKNMFTSYEEVQRLLLAAGAKEVLVVAECNPSWESAHDIEQEGSDRSDRGIYDERTWWYYVHISGVKGIEVRFW